MREIKFRSYDKKEKIMYEPLTLAEILEGNWEAQSADGYNSIPQKDYVFFCDTRHGLDAIHRPPGQEREGYL